ncbi:MAG: DUF2326 domain-containing protein [Ignavibacteriae bacterium]|nr:DUF2326 domain-containing protein [Ignavibacteriota bacterium]
MKLIKLYTAPNNLFEPVIFHPGINIIYGIKSSDDSSLHGIGKSLVLDLLDYALLSYFNPQGTTRLNRAVNKSKLGKHIIILEFSINKDIYKISRSFTKPNEANLFINNKLIHTKSVVKLRDKFADIIFYRNNYSGKFDTNWYYKLISFYLKIQQITDERFTNPIKFTNRPYDEILVYLFYLLNLNNSVLAKSLEIQTNKSNLEKSLNITKDFVTSTFEFPNLASAKTKVSTLNKKISQLSSAIKKLEIDEEYSSTQKELDEITSEIKRSLFLNHSAERRLLEFEDLSNNSDRLNTEHVEDIYSQYSSDPKLATFIKKSLDDAKEFRSSLFSSRKNFVMIERDRLKRQIEKRERDINSLKTKQRRLLKLLDSEKALDDISAAYDKLSNLESERNQIRSKLDLFDQLEESISKLSDQDSLLKIEFDEYISKIEKELNNLRSLINEIYSAIFGTIDYESLFFFTRNEKEHRLKINVIPDDKYSHGKNQGRTLVFDLAVLFNSIENKVNSPKFLIHDGIFDSLDNSHFVALYEYCDKKLKEKVDFQYIVTLNQKWQSEDLFSSSKTVNLERIEKDAVINIESDKRLLGEKF